MLRSIRTLFKNVEKVKLLQQRNIYLTGKVLGYEGEGKTTVTILNNEEGSNLMINGFSEVGFHLNNDITVLGPMAIFSKSVLSWNVNKLLDINEESLSLFTVLEPKIDILIIGVGDRLRDLSFHKKLFPFSQKHKISLEILPTDRSV